MWTTARRLSATTAALGSLLVGSAAAAAVEPPKDCGRTTIGGKRYQVKVDQITCQTGLRHTRRYIDTRARPTGYRCRLYPSRRDRVRFYCSSGRRVFFAIRR